MTRVKIAISFSSGKPLRGRGGTRDNLSTHGPLVGAFTGFKSFPGFRDLAVKRSTIFSKGPLRPLSAIPRTFRVETISLYTPGKCIATSKDIYSIVAQGTPVRAFRALKAISKRIVKYSRAIFDLFPGRAAGVFFKSHKTRPEAEMFNLI